MYQRSLVRLGVFSTFVEELKKVPAFFSYKAQEGAKKYVDSASQTLDFLKGEDPSESPEMREKRRKHKEMYQAILNEQSAKAAEEAAKAKQERAALSWRQRLSLELAEAKQALQAMTSTKAGVMAVLQHCTASHAAEVALEQGIDVKNVQMVFEKAAATNAVGYEEVVVGYIDAPAASQEEVMAFASKLHKACPVANSMHIEWRQGRPDTRDGETRRAGDVQGEVDRAARNVEWEEARQNSSSSSSSNGSVAAASSKIEEAMPQGMPGSRRAYNSASSSLRSGTSGGLRNDGEDDAFHLPGVKPKHNKGEDPHNK